jgi:hypothetical protein
MPSDSGLFKVDRLPKVDDQIKLLEKTATAQSIRQAFFDSLKAIIHRLETDPLEFGEPLYRTKQKDGIVSHALHPPIMVHYVLFESEKTVVILDIVLLTKAIP